MRGSFAGMRFSVRLALLLALLLGSACASAPGGEAAAEVRLRPCVLVLLRGGPGRAELDPAAIQEAGAGHMANIQRLAEEGSLLVAGPFIEPKVDSALRGLFVLDRADPEEALAITASDPAVQAGLLVPEAIPAESADDLGRSLALWAEALERGETPGMAKYVLAIAEPAEARRADALASDAAVLFALQLGGARAGERVLLVDREGPEQARELLAAAGADLSRWKLHPWFGSDLLR